MAIWRRLVKATSDDRPPELEHYLPPALLLQLPGLCAFPQEDTNSRRFGFNFGPIRSFKLTHITHSITFSVYPLFHPFVVTHTRLAEPGHPITLSFDS